MPRLHKEIKQNSLFLWEKDKVQYSIFAARRKVFKVIFKLKNKEKTNKNNKVKFSVLKDNMCIMFETGYSTVLKDYGALFWGNLNP